MGDHFAQGLAKNEFQYLKQAGTSRVWNRHSRSSLTSEWTFEYRLKRRYVIVLFGREIMLDWDSAGRLKANVRRLDGGGSYRLDREECHGIKELIVLLTHLYDQKHGYLIIDEPELIYTLSIRPSLCREARKIAGDPNIDAKKKVVFLITHSPFIPETYVQH